MKLDNYSQLTAGIHLQLAELHHSMRGIKLLN